MGAAPEIGVLENPHWQVGVLPGTGAWLAYGRVRTPDGAWRDLLRPTRAAALTKPLWCASYVLVPFSNRVLGGLLRFGDRTWQLRCSSGDGHAMHGTGFEYAWEVAEQSDAAVSLVLDTGGLVGANFPWSFRAEVRYAVDGQRLTIGTRLTNTAGEPFPAGFGHHPFFQRGLVDPAVAEVRLRVPAEGAYPMRDSIPVGPAGAVPARADYREIRVLDGVYEVDVVGLETGQGAVNGLKDVFAGEPDIVVSLGPGRAEDLGEDLQGLAAFALQRLTQDVLSHGVGVDVSRVERADPRVQGRAHWVATSFST